MSLLSVEAQDQLEWIKASASQGIGMCVEVARHPGGVAVRNSTRSDEAALLFSRDEFAAFLDGARRGEFDHLVDVPAPRGPSDGA